MVKAKVFIFQKQFNGLPKEGDLRLVEENLPAIKDGEFLAEAVYLSVDPYMRAYAPGLPLGKPFLGSQVARIVESKNPKYPVGRHVVGQFGWRSHTISKGEPFHIFPAAFLVPELGPDVPLSYFIGTALILVFLEICNPKKGETVVVSGAAGAVGSLVGQIAKIKGCTVIGIAGSEEKGKWLVDELGFDHFINYKTADLDKALSEVAPNGIDCYFDNVGGDTTNIILRHMNDFGRISLCGSISMYNKEDRKVPLELFNLVTKQLRMEGFVFNRWLDRWLEGVQQNHQWIQEGKLRIRETVTEGFENMFKAFVEMLQGKNFGKAVVKA
ncbi:hypothetical protein NQ315_004409 [Exocentrus adspersus]|uniref:Prostaglandin reductase 1 n=1 Tax=Exocentrus adspersus TaxID=1586481 RepID=A0AAV8W8M4_9CUCU|nr:hypothetical protein NQ315_004409 [Exocentrus adspersus]